MEVKEGPGILKNLIHEFSSTSQNIATVQALILTHEHFVPSEVLLEAIIIEWGAIGKTDQASQMRLINILKKWIDVDKRKFANPSEGMGKTLNAFISSDALPDHFRKSLTAALSAEASKTGLNDDEDDDDDVVPNVIIKKARHKHNCFLLCYDAKEIARQMTLIDQQNVANVDLREFLHTSWLKPGQAPTIEKILARADHMAMWIAYELMICKKRGKLFDQIVKIIHELKKLKNYQTAMSIYLGLHLNPVTDILEELLEFEASMGTIEIWDDICAKLDFSSNYANYREHVKTLTPPMVNIISLFLKDMLYQSEAGPNFTDSGEIEKAKLVAMGTLVNSFRKCQESPFKLEEYKELQTKLLTFRTDITIEALTRFQHDPNAIPLTKEDKSDSLSFSSSRSHADRDSDQDDQAHQGRRKKKELSTEESGISPKSSDGKTEKSGKSEKSKFSLPMRNLISSSSVKDRSTSNSTNSSSKNLVSPGREAKTSPGREESSKSEKSEKSERDRDRDTKVGERPDRANIARSSNNSGTSTPEKTHILLKKGPNDKANITSSTGSSGGHHSHRGSAGKKDSVTPEERKRRKELYENSLKEAGITTGLTLKTS